MANQTHRLLVDGELHRPERSGAGNPNILGLLNVEGGQYFQDTTTGSVYRYNGDSGSWELLVGYDRDNQRITNIGAQTVDGKIGELNVAVGVAPPEAETEGAFEVTGQQSVIVTQLSANLFVPVAEGDELKLVSVQDESIERYVTVVQGAESGGEAIIDIQDDLFRQYFPIGSHIILDGAQFEAKFSVDPSRITLKVNEERELNEFGTLVPPNGTSTTIGENLGVGFEGPELEIASTNVSADNPVRVVAGEKIQVYEPFIDGETRVQEFTVAQEGGGVFTSSPFVIPVEETSFTQVFTTRALVREPAFSSSSRISVLSDEVVLKVDSNGNIAAITLSGNADNGSQITIVADDVDINNINFNKENGTIGSNNYVEDVSGWQIEGNGDAEFNSVKIRNGSIINSIDISSFTDGNTGIQIVDTLPASGEEGSTVFLTTDSKLYRWTGSAWTAAVPTVDLVGEITETQISNDAISTPKLQANAVTANEIAANAVTANKIFAGAVTTDKIDAGAITAAKIDVTELSAISSNIGLITAGTIDASQASVTNLDADNITSGTINAQRIGADSITADKLDVTNLNAVTTSTGNLNVDGTLTVQAGGSIQGSNYSFDDTGGTIAGWIIDSGTLKSNASGARIELNESDNRVSIFDAIGEKAVMGYLDGLDRNSGSGQWGSSNYGFWAKNGDELVIDGDIEYDSGDWLIENDASYKVLDGSSNEIIRLGTDSGNKGLFIYNTSQTTSSSTDAGRSYFTGDVIASFQDSELVVGDEASNTYMKYDDSAGKLEVAGDIEAKGVSTATAFAYKNIEINSGNLSTYLKSYTHSGNTYHVLDLTTASSKESAQYIKFTVDTRSGGTDRPITHIVPPSNNADDSFEITIEVSGDGGTGRDEFVSFMDAPVNSPTVTLSDGGSQAVSANFKIEAFRIFQGETQFDHVPMEGVLNGFGGFLQGVTHGQYTFRKDDDSFRLINSSVAQTGRASQSMYIGKLEGGALLQAEPGSLGASDGFDFIISPTKRYQNTGDNITESDDYTLGSNFDFSNEFRFSQDDVRWEFDGDVYIGGTLTNPSDQRYKENVEELGDVLEKLDGLQTVVYDLKDFLPSDETKMIGLFAQEVQEVFPEAVVDGTIIDDNNEERDMKSISYTQLVPVLVKAIQELKTRIEALEQQS